MPNLNYAPHYENIQGMEAQLHILRTTCIKCPASQSGRFISGQNVPCASWWSGWVVPRIGLEGLEKQNNLAWGWNLTPDLQVVQPVV